jgi:sterol desaturase/sphingolipid hydroxylase (fatty acid hydroxylase superfamily)
MKEPIPVWIVAPLVLTAGALILWFEKRRPLRARGVEPKVARNARNLAVAGIAAIMVQFVELPVALPLAAMAEQRGWGLLQMFRLPLWVELTAAVLALDYTLYWWHVCTHRIKLLWRFHLPHHADLEMDASTCHFRAPRVQESCGLVTAGGARIHEPGLRSRLLLRGFPKKKGPAEAGPSEA